MVRQDGGQLELQRVGTSMQCRSRQIVLRMDQDEPDLFCFLGVLSDLAVFCDFSGLPDLGWTWRD